MERRLVLCGLASLPFPAWAQANPFLGRWRSQVTLGTMLMTTETTFTAAMEFVSTSIGSGGYRVDSLGTYSFPSPNVIRIVNVRWSPPEIQLPPDEHSQFEVLSPTQIRIRPMVPGLPVVVIHRVG